MTKLREPGSHHEALHQSLAMLGDHNAAAATGKSSGHLRLCSNPDETREVLYVDAVKLSRAIASMGETPPLLTHLRLTCERWQPDGEKAAPADPRGVLFDCMQAVGDLAGTFRQAMADGTLSPRERQDLRAEVADLRKLSDDLWAALEDPREQEIATLQALGDSLHERELKLVDSLTRERAQRISLQARIAARKGKGKR